MSFSEAVAQRGLNSPYDAQIATSAAGWGVDPTLVKAVISQESSWNPQAYRGEPRLNDASYGLMQVLLATARATSGNPTLTSADLFQPEINIDIGTRFLATQLTRFGYPDGISAYNAGHPISTNQLSYVEPVLAYQAWFQANDPLFGSPPENPPVPSGGDSGGVLTTISDTFTNLFGDGTTAIDPVTGQPVTTDILAGAGIGLVLLTIGAVWLLTRR